MDRIEVKTWTEQEQREHRRLWIEALRSGKYRQARNALKNERGYCCLGVACDVSGLGRWVGDAYVVGDEGDDDNLPEPVAAWLGLRSVGGVYKHGTLWALNDEERKKFSYIADIIESEPDGLIAKAGA